MTNTRLKVIFLVYRDKEQAQCLQEDIVLETLLGIYTEYEVYVNQQLKRKAKTKINKIENF